MARGKWTAALLTGLLLSLPAVAQAPPNPSGATTQRATVRSPLRTAPRAPHSHRSPQHHRRAHGAVTHGTPIHGTMAGPRM